jgi:DNA-binding transcriptional LysR family regulator
MWSSVGRLASRRDAGRTADGRASWRGLSLGCFPRSLPLALSTRMPSLVRRRIRSASNLLAHQARDAEDFTDPAGIFGGVWSGLVLRSSSCRFRPQDELSCRCSPSRGRRCPLTTRSARPWGLEVTTPSALRRRLARRRPRRPRPAAWGSPTGPGWTTTSPEAVPADHARRLRRRRLHTIVPRETQDYPSAIQFAAEGLGITVLPGSAWARCQAPSPQIPDPKPIRRIALRIRDTVADTPAATRLVGLLDAHERAPDTTG